MESTQRENTQSNNFSWRDALEDHKEWLQTDIPFGEYHGFNYKEAGFDLETQMKQRRDGIIIDVGGPTRTFGEAFNVDSSAFKRVFSTNISKKAYTFSSENVDFQADGRKLPLSSDSVDVVFAEGVMRPLASGFIEEGARVLKQNGLMLIHSCNEASIKIGENLGLEVKEIVNVDEKDPGDLFLVVFQKLVDVKPEN